MFPVDKEASLPLSNGTFAAIKAKRSKLSRKEKPSDAGSSREAACPNLRPSKKGPSVESASSGSKKPGSSPLPLSRQLA
jgi:hypothetical protein